MNIEEINNTIEELENGSTTFDSCLKLASLYIVKEHISHTNLNEFDGIPDVIKEYNDILPQYTEYCDIKTQYQLGKVSQEYVIQSMKNVCTEIHEFIDTLYNNTDTQEERELITATLNTICEQFNIV